MINNSILRIFLILSIVIILLGILTIIFIQFDQGYVLMSTENDFHKEQRNLINHVYQTQVQEQSAGENPLVMKLNKATVVIQTQADEKSAQKEPVEEIKPVEKKALTDELIQQQKTAIDQIRNNNSIWQQRQAENDYANDYQMMLLRNNPWSPHYRPNQ